MTVKQSRSNWRAKNGWRLFYNIATFFSFTQHFSFISSLTHHLAFLFHLSLSLFHLSHFFCMHRIFFVTAAFFYDSTRIILWWWDWGEFLSEVREKQDRERGTFFMLCLHLSTWNARNMRENLSKSKACATRKNYDMIRKFLWLKMPWKLRNTRKKELECLKN